MPGSRQSRLSRLMKNPVVRRGRAELQQARSASRRRAERRVSRSAADVAAARAAPRPGLVLAARDRAGRVDQRPARPQRRAPPRSSAVLDLGQALDRPRRLAPARVGARGERAEVRAGRRRARTRSKPAGSAGSVASPSNTVTLRRPSRVAWAAISAARSGSSSTEITSPRSPIRAAIWPVLIPGPAQRSSTCSPGPRVEHLDHRGGAAALRRQLAGRDQLRHRVAGPRPTTIIGLRRRSSGHGRRRRARRRTGALAAQRAPSAARRRRAACRRRSATSAGSLQAASSERAASGPSSPTTSAPARAAPSGRPRRPPGSSRRRAAPRSARSRSRAARRSTALTRPDGVRRAGALDQLDRLVDRGVVGRAVGEEQLVEAEPQRRQHRRVEQPRSPAGEPLDRGVGGAAALHGAVGEPLRLGPLAPAEPAALGACAEGAARCGRSCSKVAADRAKASAGGRVRSRQASARRRVAAQVVGGGHRPAAGRLDDLEPQRPVAQPSSSAPHSALHLRRSRRSASTAWARRTPRRSRRPAPGRRRRAASARARSRASSAAGRPGRGGARRARSSPRRSPPPRPARELELAGGLQVERPHQQLAAERGEPPRASRSRPRADRQLLAQRDRAGVEPGGQAHHADAGALRRRP